MIRKRTNRWIQDALPIAAATLLCGALVAGCASDNPTIPDSFQQQDFQVQNDALACQANNDGVIELSELLFDQRGLVANYRVNPPGTLTDVDVGGETVEGERRWDHTDKTGVVTRIKTEDPKDWWFAEHFPDATLAIATDAKGETLQVLSLEASRNRMLLLGLASRKPDVTLMVYDPPVEIMRFPLQVGTKFTSTGEVENGTLNNLPIATRDTYEVEVDAEGTVQLPSIRFKRSLRVKVRVTSKSVGGVSGKLLQYQWFHECFGEIVRIVSETDLDGGEPPDDFTKATEYRRLSF